MTEPFAAVDVIRTKRDRGALSDDQIEWVIDAYVRGVVADEQMSALAMAVLLNGMDRRELARWTAAMAGSGTRLDLSSLQRPVVDKHSTGGVGDKISLVLVPLVAACGAAVPQVAGRGLGHTGGTIDKLESVKGWRAQLTGNEMLETLREVGAVICAAGPDLAPADRKLYALRDVTATVEGVALIASSIMSKKLAEGTRALVLDVKVGQGAFAKDLAQARELARTMVELGTDAGVRTSALITSMEAPLGRAVGNALEVREAVEVLNGDGPGDVRELTLRLAREMLDLVGMRDVDPGPVLDSGRALVVWRRMISSQGGDPDAPLPVARHSEVLRAGSSGVVTGIGALAVGRAAWLLGAGRARSGDSVSPGSGIELLVSVGDEVRAGQPVVRLHADDAARLPAALAELANAVAVGSRAELVERPLVIERIGP